MFEGGMEKAASAYDSQLAVAAPRRMSMKERLVAEKRNIEARLDQINEALKALEEAPQIEKILEILSKTIY